MFALSHAGEAFDPEGKLKDPKTAERLEREVTGFVRLAEWVVPVCGKVASAGQQRQAEIARALEEQSVLQPPVR